MFYSCSEATNKAKQMNSFIHPSIDSARIPFLGVGPRHGSSRLASRASTCPRAPIAHFCILFYLVVYHILCTHMYRHIEVYLILILNRTIQTNLGLYSGSFRTHNHTYTPQETSPSQAAHTKAAPKPLARGCELRPQVGDGALLSEVCKGAAETMARY